MGKKKISEKLNNELKQFNYMLDMLVCLCEEYQDKYNNNSLAANEDLNYTEGIFTYYNILLSKKMMLEANKKIPEVEELISIFKSKSDYIKSLKLVRDNKTSTIDELLKNKNEELKQISGRNPSNVKMIKVKLPILGFWSAVKDVIINFLLMSVIIFAISGFINFGTWTSFYDLIYFILYFSLSEMILKFTLLSFFKKLIVKTLGAILLIPFVIATVLICVLPIFVKIDSYFSLVMILILSSLIRKFIIGYFDDKKMKNKLGREGE